MLDKPKKPEDEVVGMLGGKTVDQVKAAAEKPAKSETATVQPAAKAKPEDQAALGRTAKREAGVVGEPSTKKEQTPKPSRTAQAVGPKRMDKASISGAMSKSEKKAKRERVRALSAVSGGTSERQNKAARKAMKATGLKAPSGTSWKSKKRGSLADRAKQLGQIGNLTPAQKHAARAQGKGPAVRQIDRGGKKYQLGYVHPDKPDDVREKPFKGARREKGQELKVRSRKGEAVQRKEARATESAKKARTTAAIQAGGTAVGGKIKSSEATPSRKKVLAAGEGLMRRMGQTGAGGRAAQGFKSARKSAEKELVVADRNSSLADMLTEWV